MFMTTNKLIKDGFDINLPENLRSFFDRTSCHYRDVFVARIYYENKDRLKDMMLLKNVQANTYYGLQGFKMRLLAKKDV